GSTGFPKAIAGRLRGIDHFVSWEIKTFGLTLGTRVSQLISPMFDAVLRDIFAPLCAGGTICLPPHQKTIMGGFDLGRWLVEQKINLVHIVPSMFRMMMDQHDPDIRFDSLEYVLMSGERVLPADVKKWYSLGSAARLVNLYGPSETTMTKFVYFINSDDQFRRTVPIGKPIDGAKAIVVDNSQFACPNGTVGEIYIRTPYRSLGYYRQPELTDSVFVPNPFSKDSGDIVYKTGDLARILEDGNFEFVGRKDDQVKVRGVRIELGEIETALAACESVAQAVVADHVDAKGNKFLCAYIIARRDASAGEIRKQLRTTLPEYMMPNSYKLLNEFPLTLTGKIDRGALPKPDVMSVREYLAPRTPIEEVLARIWASVLGVERIGIRENFFECGGHSLSATQLSVRVRKVFQTEVPLRWLLEWGTIEAMASAIQDQRWGIKTNHDAVTLRRSPEFERKRLSYAQQRLWFLYQMEPGSSAYNLFSAVRLQGNLNIGLLQSSLNEVVRRHEVLRTTFLLSPTDEPEIFIRPELKIELPIRSVAGNREEQLAEVDRMMRMEAQQPFDLRVGPLVRAQLLRLSEMEHVALFVLHHIISDAWSQTIFVEEIGTIYTALSKNELVNSEELTIQYADYAVWQREWSRGEALEVQLAYWRKQLYATSGMLALPTDRPRPTAQTYHGAHLSFRIGEDLSQALQELAWRENATLYMVLLAALQVLAGKYSGQRDICIGTPVGNRSHQETERLIGLFVNTLVMRTELDDRDSFYDLLKRVKETAIEAYVHQDIPFEMLVDELDLERDPSRSPLFQVMFALQNVPEHAVILPELSVDVLLPNLETSKFDLTVFINQETGYLGAVWEYNTDLFDELSIAQMARHWQNLLQTIVSCPEVRLAEVPLMDAAERSQILVGWNQTAREYLPHKTVVHQFEEWAAATP
ncbi:MAG TPA: condensation domain-containing protein, partial [Edaphobacter sp.]|nr:condensation domain-containing protein [Edaphobacter sp.]